LSGSLHFSSVGAPSLITLWGRTKGNLGVMGVSALTTYPLYLNVRNPNVKSIKDFTDKDKIAVPAVKVSTQAIMLQMAAEKAFGEGNHYKLDPYTITLSHPDGMAALMSNTGGVDAHFTTSPFHEQELKIPGVRTLTTSYEILGGRATALVVVTSTKFRDANPKTYSAFFAALKEAVDGINRDKKAATLSRMGERQEVDGRRSLCGDFESRLRVYADAGKSVQDRRVHGQDRLDQGRAQAVAGHVLSGSA
jgi:NitT/TauT family transport system substrate-binding protein